MRKVRRSALVPYSAEQMFALVDDVTSYEKFLPWCSSSVEHDRGEQSVSATLELNKGGVSKEFTTRNVRHPYEAIEMHLLDGPFSHLEGLWSFEQMGDEGSKITLKIDFEFASMMVGMVFGAYFEQTCNQLVDSFTKRAQAVYG